MHKAVRKKILYTVSPRFFMSQKHKTGPKVCIWRWGLPEKHPSKILYQKIQEHLECSGDDFVIQEATDHETGESKMKKIENYHVFISKN